MRIRSVFHHTAQALAEGALIALIVVGLVAGSAFAARGGGGKPSGGGGTGSGISITVPSGVFGGTTIASVTGGGSSEWAHIICMQNGQTALLSWEPTDSTGHASFQLGPTSSWTSGSASCTGQAGHYDSRSRWQTDASTTFGVSG